MVFARMNAALLASLVRQRRIPQAVGHELCARHDAELFRLLPVLGPLFGVTLLLFSLWDRVMDPAGAAATLPLRIAALLLGAVACFPNRLQWSVRRRCVALYWLYAGTVIVCQFMLEDGYLYGLAGVITCVFLASIAALRLRGFLQLVSFPTLLFMLLSFIRLPLWAILNGWLFYALALLLAWLNMLLLRRFRYAAYLHEQALLTAARYDGLSGACGRAYFGELAQRELEQARRHARPLAIAMLDIDHFKQVNDTHGHAAGDQAIRVLARTCAATLRQIDYFGRIGGEEFAALLPETGPQEALRCAERLRSAIAAAPVAVQSGPLFCTVSIGVAMLRPEHDDWLALLADADAALYRAKHEGRDRVVLATP